ncbi:hypothetical protein, partial [Corynebacterium macginleyi]|uniref:hypothetical protein n=1 Tax=Corynebacterium macginleyi TaxID=38290 RepID=UPI00190CE19E
MVALDGRVAALHPPVFVTAVAGINGGATLLAPVGFLGLLGFLVGAAGFGTPATIGDSAGCEMLMFFAAARVGLAGGVSRRQFVQILGRGAFGLEVLPTSRVTGFRNPLPCSP